MALWAKDGRSLLLRVCGVLVGILLTTLSANAQDATWLSNPGSNDINLGSNWSTGTIPTGTASFGASNTTTLFSSGFGQTFGGWTFNAGASAYTIALTPGGGNLATQFVGAGIAINGGSVSISNPGLRNGLYFANSSTAGGAQITNSGSLYFSNSSTAGTAAITNNVQLQFSGTSSADRATIVDKPGGGVFFYSNSNAGNATITNNSLSGLFPGIYFYSVSAPGLGFYGASTAGNATITTAGGLTQFFDQSTAGNARLILISGTVDFSGTTGPNGDGKVSAGSIEGTGNYFLGSRELTVGSNNLSTQVAGSINDGGPCLSPCLGGSLVKIGTGTLTLSGINSYSGTTTVNGGALIVDSSIASSSMTTVNTGAVLGGVGIVGNTTIASGGIFAPGNGTPGSSMTVAGNLALQSGAMYTVTLNTTTASFANVTGAVTPGGATINAFYANGSYISKQYTILTAGSVSGTFGLLVNNNLPANFTTSLSYDPTHAYLNLALNFPPPPGATYFSGLNGNQQAVGNALINVFNTTGGIPLVFGTFTPTALSQASGESATGSQQTTFQAMTQFLGTLLDPSTGRSGDTSQGGAIPYLEEDNASAYASDGKPHSKSERDAYAAIYRKGQMRNTVYDPRWSVWAAGFGGSQTTDGNGALGSNTATSRIVGTAVGADYWLSPRTMMGFALAGGGTSFSVANSGSGRSDLFQAGAFVKHTVGSAYVSGALAYGWQDITTNRTLSIAGIDQLQARFNANAYSGRVEGGYRFVAPVMDGIGITPYAAAQFTTFDLPAYAESVISGAGTFALAYGARDMTDSRSELGFRTDKSYALNDVVLTIRGRAAWAHDFNPDRNIGASFQALPGAWFVVNGAAQAPDSALTTASAELKWTNNWSVAGTFEGEFSSVTASYAGKGVVRYAW